MVAGVKQIDAVLRHQRGTGISAFVVKKRVRLQAYAQVPPCNQEIKQNSQSMPQAPHSAWLTMRMRSSRAVSLISMDFITHSFRIRLASSNTRFIRRSGTIHGTIATTSSGQDA